MKDVQSPVRASCMTENWLSLSIFTQMLQQNRLPEAFGLI